MDCHMKELLGGDMMLGGGAGLLHQNAAQGEWKTGWGLLRILDHLTEVEGGLPVHMAIFDPAPVGESILAITNGRRNALWGSFGDKKKPNKRQLQQNSGAGTKKIGPCGSR